MRCLNGWFWRAYNLSQWNFLAISLKTFINKYLCLRLPLPSPPLSIKQWLELPFPWHSGRSWSRSPCSLHQLYIPTHPSGITNREISKTVCRNMSWMQWKLVFQGWHMHKKIPLCRNWPKPELFLLLLSCFMFSMLCFPSHSETIFKFLMKFLSFENKKVVFLWLCTHPCSVVFLVLENHGWILIPSS